MSFQLQCLARPPSADNYKCHLKPDASRFTSPQGGVKTSKDTFVALAARLADKKGETARDAKEQTFQKKVREAAPAAGGS